MALEEEPASDSQAGPHTIYTWEDISNDERKILQTLTAGSGDICLVAYSDLLFSGRFGRSRLILTTKYLIVTEGVDQSKRIPLSEIHSLYCKDFVGNGVLFARTTEGGRAELIRYSRTMSDTFHAFADRVNRTMSLSEDELEEHEEELAKTAGPQDERKMHRCPKCGHPLLYPSDPCPVCTSKRRVIGRLLSFLVGHRLLLAVGTLTSFLVVGITLAPPILVRFLIDDVLKEHGLSQAVRLQRVWHIVGAFLVLILARMTIQHVRIKVMGTLAARVVMDLRRELFRSLQRLSLSYYESEHTGRIMSRVLRDTEHVQQFVVGGLQQLMVHSLMAIFIPIIMLVEHWKLAIIALAPIPVAAYLGSIFSSRYRAIFRTARRRFAALSAAVSDAISGVQVVKSFTQEERETRSFNRRTKDIYDIQLSAVRTRAYFDPTVLFTMTLGTLVVWLIGSRWVIFGVGALTTGMLIQFISYMNQLYNPVQQLIQLAEVFQQSATAAERVFGVMDMPSDVGDRENAVELPDVKGRIRLQNVSFKYGDGQRVLKNVDVTIEPGEMIGLVGETGSGKSTLVSLVCRFYDPTKGAVLLDGIDLRDIKVKSLRSKIGMVLQNTYLFEGTIRENIAYGKPGATEREIIGAAKAANAHDFIMGLPDGYDSHVGERGTGLSGGEKQRIAIARAILKDPAILILDEATSAVDTATEQSIQEAMDRLIKGRTTIAIAHRLSTLRNADKLYVMDKGEIVEQGTHEELIRYSGRYAKLCSIQADFAKHVAEVSSGGNG